MLLGICFLVKRVGERKATKMLEKLCPHTQDTHLVPSWRLLVTIHLNLKFDFAIRARHVKTVVPTQPARGTLQRSRPPQIDQELQKELNEERMNPLAQWHWASLVRLRRMLTGHLCMPWEAIIIGVPSRLKVEGTLTATRHADCP